MSRFARPKRWRWCAASALLAGAVPVPAQAELGASVAAVTDLRYRGRSITGGRAAATFDLGYDDTGGAYAGVSLSGVASREGARLLGVSEYVGYAHRMPSGRVLDFGLLNRDYTRFYASGRTARDTQVYAGLIGRRVSGYLWFAPDYYGRGSPAVYAELNTTAKLPAEVRLALHAGLLTFLAEDRDLGSGRTRYDWRVAVTRPFGPVILSLAWSGAGPAHDYALGRERRRTGLVLGVSHAF